MWYVLHHHHRHHHVVSCHHMTGGLSGIQSRAKAFARHCFPFIAFNLVSMIGINDFANNPSSFLWRSQVFRTINFFYRSFRGFKDEKYLPPTHPNQYGTPGSIVPDFGDNIDQQFGESTNSVMDVEEQSGTFIEH